MSPRFFDRLRTRFTSGLEVATTSQEVARGDHVDAVVTVSDPTELGTIEVGLVCTERYATLVGTPDSPDQGTSRATAHEAWAPLESTAGSHSLRFQVPADGPFSYEGEVLSYTWEIVARGVRKRALDARASCEIRVRP